MGNGIHKIYKGITKLFKAVNKSDSSMSVNKQFGSVANFR